MTKSGEATTVWNASSCRYSAYCLYTAVDNLSVPGGPEDILMWTSHTLASLLLKAMSGGCLSGRILDTLKGTPAHFSECEQADSDMTELMRTASWGKLWETSQLMRTASWGKLWEISQLMRTASQGKLWEISQLMRTASWGKLWEISQLMRTASQGKLWETSQLLRKASQGKPWETNQLMRKASQGQL